MHADVIVVGLGGVGSATVYQLAKRGVRVLGLDRFAPPHDQGSSHGETRITRQAIGEGGAYMPLARRAHPIWRELEAETGAELLRQVGGLVLAPPGAEARQRGKPDFLGTTIAVARQFGIPHEVLSDAEIPERFPQFEVPSGTRGYFEPGAGYLNVEACVSAHLEAARARGADLRTDEAVLGLDSGPDGVRVRTERGEYQAAEVVVCAGAWLPKLLPDLPGLFRIDRQMLFWLKPEADLWPEDAGPIFIWTHGATTGEYVYGFPAHGGRVKLGSEVYGAATDPDRVRREVGADEMRAFYLRNVAGKLRGLDPDVLAATTCLYTSTPDGDFVIDAHPTRPRVTLVSACSGHGFKHTAAIGEAVAQRLVDGASEVDLSPFRLSRFGVGEVAWQL